MNKEIEHIQSKLMEAIQREQVTHLFIFEKDYVQISVEHTASIWFYIFIVVFIIVPVLVLLSSTISIGYSWAYQIPSLIALIFGSHTLFDRFLRNKQVIHLDFVSESVRIQNVFPKIHPIQKTIAIPFKTIAHFDTVMIGGISYIGKTQRLRIIGKDQDVKAYVDLCASLENRAVLKIMMRYINDLARYWD